MALKGTTKYFYFFQSKYNEVVKIGITNDLNGRLKEHLRSGLVKDNSAYYYQVKNPINNKDAGTIEQEVREKFKQHTAGYDLLYATKKEVDKAAKEVIKLKNIAALERMIYFSNLK